MSERSLTWWESQYDSDKIRGNNWNLQLAQSVAAGVVPPVSNVIWQSKALAPVTHITWKVEYGLNWSATLPSAGVNVVIAGEWQACDKGQVYDITSNGYWATSTEAPVTDWLKVGKVNYKYPGVSGIHIVVGIRDALTGEFSPIFIDSAQLPPGSSATYQPQETVTWALQGGNLAGQVYNQTLSRSATKDFSKAAPSTGKYAWWTTFIFDDGQWIISENAPSKRHFAPPVSTLLALSIANEPVQLLLGPLGWLVVFGIAIAAEARPDLVQYLVATLGSSFNGLQISFQGGDGIKLEITYTGSVGRSLAALDGDESQKSIDNALKSALGRGLLNLGETWTLTPEDD